MKSIKMKSTQKGSWNGAVVHEYLKGQTYPNADAPMSDELADVFIAEGWAVEAGTVEESSLEVPSEEEARREAERIENARLEVETAPAGEVA